MEYRTASGRGSKPATSQVSSYDVAVLGAGPAGAIAATLLARSGFSVAMYDPDSRESERIGESLPASAANLLDRHALPGPLSNRRHSPITGTISKWGEVRTEDSSLVRPGGTDWRLDRLVFDTELRAAAISSGVVHLGSQAERLQRKRGQWLVHDDRKNSLIVPLIIDATGRRAMISRSYGGSRQRQSSQVAIWAVGPPLSEAATAKTLVETYGEGWWYGALLPSRRPIAAYHVSPARAAEIRRQPDIWHQLFRRTSILSKELSENAFEDVQLNYTDATGFASGSPAGRNWIACGDAAAAFDPIASQGLLHAIRTGIAAADVVSGKQTTFEYCSSIQTIWAHYLARYEVLQARATIG